MLKMRNIVFLIILLCVGCTSDSKYPYLYYNPKNFKHTSVYPLAKMVLDNDTADMNEFLADNKGINIDTRDSYFGSTLLMFSIFNDKYDAFMWLLNHGADVNAHADYLKKSPLQYACKYSDDDFVPDDRYCKELIKRGADVNYNKVIFQSIGHSFRGAKYVKVLVEAGANYKYVLDDLKHTPADEALILDNLEAAYYLICKKGAYITQEPRITEDKYLGDRKLIMYKKYILKYLSKHKEQCKWKE